MSDSNQTQHMETDPEETKSKSTSVDDLQDQIKDLTKQITKKDNLQKKTEERLKDKVKQIKVFTAFFSSIFNDKVIDQIFDKEKKTFNLSAEQLTKLHSETYTDIKSMPQKSPEKPKQQLKDQSELLQLFKEENENLKQKFVEMSQQLQYEQQRNQQQASRVKDDSNLLLKMQNLEMTVSSLEEAMFEKDQEIKSLRLKQTDADKNKAIQLLEALKTKPTISTQPSQQSENSSADTESLQNLKMQMSEKTNKILELNEKLAASSETINALEERISSLLASQQVVQQQLEPTESIKEHQQHQSESDQTASVGDNASGVDDNFKQKISDLEAQKQDVQESLEMYRQRARQLVMKKDIHIHKLKLIIANLECHLKLNLAQSQETINRIAALSPDELNMIEESLNQLGVQEISPFMISDDHSDAQVINHVDRQVQKQLGAQPPQPQQEQILLNNLEYIRNVFVKYLEYLAQNNSKEIVTIENVLFTELNVTKDQATRLNLLRSQNTFWKKYLSISAASGSAAQGIMKTKFSAGELKKKLFGGVMTMMQQQPAAASATQRSSVVDSNYNDILNRSINSPPPFQNTQIIEASTLSQHGILNTTGGLGDIGKMDGDDLFYSIDETHSKNIKDKRHTGVLQ